MPPINYMIDLTKVYDITPQWLAGFFDGEGMVGIYNNSLEVKISQKDPTILVLIASKFNHCSWGNSQKAAELRFYGSSALEILEYITPYAIVKKTQIVLALQFLNGIYPKNIEELLKLEKLVR
jgi:hypothetical protein